ncbi:CoA-acylating methylmalonate-semialdehyde dehydrogenase [Cellulomonas sp. Sa3CUA2]|uniref:methylmalonate-semialdehyde dehydrogenase (CoA acylating) n=1 Tax=Cellulomonas avistercoris TaxID=2762242 RepID=A0ABR8QGY1_9CELL|nr:CoA-acylating methylmalonate-semialdehyde dehydrogenase [Cellulomonas avistercoris]MBD7919606.1 CoA-acylating methylmalonate-semialdehyde dehydrogenase [Cellulomonas avistercoris]
MTEYQVDHWIGGATVPGSGEGLPLRNPATGLRIGTVARADGGVVDRAVAAAAEAQRDWAATSLARRTEILFRMRDLVVQHSDELARTISREHGKTVPDALGEVGRGRETLDFVCGINHAAKGEFTVDASTGVDVHSLRQPLGVVAGITPFNFPAMVPFWMHPVAIATGNAFLLKPSERDPSASNLVAELYREAGLPDGVFNVVHGDKEAVDAILKHPGIAAVSFVGSTPIARYVQQTAIAHGKRVQALGGANNHAVVMPDADPSFAAEQLAAAAFGSAGQRCMAVTTAVAVGAAADPLVQELRTRAEAVVVGPGDDPGTDMGPVITDDARRRVVDYVTAAVDAGAVPVVDGRDVVVEGHEKGYFVGPTVLDRVTTDMGAYCDEVFGPLLAVLRVDTFEEALDLVNSSPFGNGSAIFTASGEHARRFTLGVTAGMVGVNVPIPVPVAYYSFGGWKDSLFGDHHAHGPEAVRFYTRAKVVTTRWPHQEDRVAASMSFPSTTH